MHKDLHILVLLYCNMKRIMMCMYLFNYPRIHPLCTFVNLYVCICLQLTFLVFDASNFGVIIIKFV